MLLSFFFNLISSFYPKSLCIFHSWASMVNGQPLSFGIPKSIHSLINCLASREVREFYHKNKYLWSQRMKLSHRKQSKLLCCRQNATITLRNPPQQPDQCFNAYTIYPRAVIFFCPIIASQNKCGSFHK